MGVDAQNADAGWDPTYTNIERFFRVLVCRPTVPPLPLQGTETSVRCRFLGSS